jgi:proteasome lid subunit RPN8/RPN11
MIRIENAAWAEMVRHAQACYPRECCGILLGTVDGADKRVASIAIACRNAYEGDRPDRFALDPKDMIAAERQARQSGLDVLGFFHSHPDEESYFSATDLANSAPWYSNVVMSVRNGAVKTARAFIANVEQTEAPEEELSYPR